MLLLKAVSMNFDISSYAKNIKMRCMIDPIKKDLIHQDGRKLSNGCFVDIPNIPIIPPKVAYRNMLTTFKFDEMVGKKEDIESIAIKPKIRPTITPIIIRVTMDGFLKNIFFIIS